MYSTLWVAWQLTVTFWYCFSAPLGLVSLDFEFPKLQTVGFACWSDEDYIGKVCRVARRLNAGNLVVSRVISRSLMKYQRYFRARLWFHHPFRAPAWCCWSGSARSCWWCIWNVAVRGFGKITGDQWGIRKMSRAVFLETSNFSETSKNRPSRARKKRYRNLCINGGLWFVWRTCEAKIMTTNEDPLSRSSNWMSKLVCRSFFSQLSHSIHHVCKFKTNTVA